MFIRFGVLALNMLLQMTATGSSYNLHKITIIQILAIEVSLKLLEQLIEISAIFRRKLL